MNSQSNDLKKSLSELNDETLLQIVEVDYADYRQDALDCAKLELASRGIVVNERDIVINEPTGQEEPEDEEVTFHPELVTVATYTSPYEAQIAKGLLETNGIPAFVANEHFVGVNWLLSNAIGGVRLQVTETDAEQAESLLNPDFAPVLIKEELMNEAEEAQPIESENESYWPQLKTLVRAMLFLCLIVMAFGGWDFLKPVIPPPLMPKPILPATSKIARSPARLMTEEEVTAQFMRSHSAILALCLAVETTHISFQVLEIVIGEDTGRKMLKVAHNQNGQIFNIDDYAEQILPGDKTVLFLDTDDLATDDVLKPVEFLTAFYDEADRKKEQEMIQSFIGLPLFFADTGKAYSETPDFIPLKDFLVSLKKQK